MKRLPTGWIECRVDEAGEITLGRQRSPEHHSGAFMRPYLRVANVYEDRIDTTSILRMNFTPREFEVYELRREDILLNEGQSLELVGRPAMYRGEVSGACFQNTLLRFRSRPCVEPRFALLEFRYFLHTQRFQKIARWTTNIAHLGTERLAAMGFLLPPLAEQRRIVAEIEKQFTRLDAAVAALKRTQANLKRYRTSVLKAAVQGRLVLTESALASRDGRPFESGKDLLRRIELIRQRTSASTKRESTALLRGGSAIEPVEAPTAMQEQPQGWTRARWSEVGHSQNGRAFPSAEYRANGIRLLRPGNLHASGQVVWADKNTARLAESWAIEFPSFVVGSGEIVMNLTAQSLKDEFLGRACITGPNDRCLLNQRIARLTPIELHRRYVLWVFKSFAFRRFVDDLNTGSLIQHMFTSQIGEFVLPIPPLAEQHRIVAEVERRLSVVDEVEKIVETSLARAAKLRQSILERAFEGRLVPQDPNDEPASVLLERIRAERSQRETAATSARRGVKTRRRA